jgi:hypothetical protein
VRTGFRLKVDKDGLITLDIKNLARTGKAGKNPIVTVSFVHPDMDGVAFERCLKGLRNGDIVEVRFLPYLSKEAEKS